jgi:hypothetical protein
MKTQFTLKQVDYDKQQKEKCKSILKNIQLQQQMLLEAKRMRKHRKGGKRKRKSKIVRAGGKNLNRSLGEPSNAPRKSRMAK